MKKQTNSELELNDKVISTSNITSPNFLPNTSYRKEGRYVKEFDKYGQDRTGTIRYIFNDLGYRGENYNPDAQRLIYVAGCSHTFGTGLEWEDTFSYIFKKEYAKNYELNIEDVNLMNFSVGAASNSYLVRTLITQCNVLKPDVLICNFAHKKNLEIKSPDSNTPYCPSIEQLENAGIINKMNTKLFKIVSNNKRRRPDFLKHPYFNDANLFVETVKNMLLLQYFCELKDIDYIFAWIDYKNLQSGLDDIEYTHRFLSEELNLDHFLDKSVRDTKIDFGADKESHDVRAHGGIKTNNEYGKRLFKKYLELYNK